MAFQRRGFKGGVRDTTIPGGINDAVTTIPGADLSTWAGITSTGIATAIINVDKSDEEVITFAGVSGGNLTTVVRGAAGTTAQAHASGASLTHGSSFTDFDEANKVVSDLNTWTSYTPTYSSLGSMTVTELSHPSNHRRFLRVGKLALVSFSQVLTVGGTRQAGFDVSLPVAAASPRCSFSADVQNGVGRATTADSTTVVTLARADGATLTAGDFHFSFHGFYEIA